MPRSVCYQKPLKGGLGDAVANDEQPCAEIKVLLALLGDRAGMEFPQTESTVIAQR